MAEVKDKVVSVEVLKAAYDDLKGKISLETLGITATAEELNQLGGQESPIKQQFENLQDSIERLENDIDTVSNDVTDIMSGKGSGSTCIILAASEWNENTQSVVVSGVTDKNTVITSPTPDCLELYAQCSIKCTAQNNEGLTFTCSESPTSDIYVNVLVLNIGSLDLQNFVLTAYTNPGATVTVTNSQKTLKKTADYKGGASFIVTPGVWSVVADSNGLISENNVSVVGDTVFDIIVNKIPAFTYTGDYEIVDDGDNAITYSTSNWKIRFLTSGTLVFDSLNGAEDGIDVFCVGGGSGGCGYAVGGGGGGGYTSTLLRKSITVDTEYQIEIGAGGTSSEGMAIPGAGGTTTAFGVTAAGASHPDPVKYPSFTNGGNGGSGGGSGGATDPAEDLYVSAGVGGLDGANGSGTYGGRGQGTTTREFGEVTGRIYAAGGNGANEAEGSAGEPNTGNGGDGFHDGGSGIVVIRNARENTPNSITYLYVNGDQCRSITGGWTNNSQLTSDSSLMLHAANTTGGGSASHAYTNNAINLTEFKEIQIRCVEESSAGTLTLYVSSEQNADSAILTHPITASGVYTVDVSDVQGEYYLGFTYYLDYNGGYSQAQINSVCCISDEDI